MKKIAAVAYCTPVQAALAHGNHGVEGSHWHASDAFGLILVTGLVVLAIWLSRGGK